MMGAKNEKGRPRQGDQFSSNSSTAKSTEQVGHAHRPAPMHAIAIVTTVVAARGNSRDLLVWRCTVCGHRHLSQGRGDLPPVVRRKGPHGPVLLHVVTSSTAVAA